MPSVDEVVGAAAAALDASSGRTGIPLRLDIAHDGAPDSVSDDRSPTVATASSATASTSTAATSATSSSSQGPGRPLGFQPPPPPPPPPQHAYSHHPYPHSTTLKEPYDSSPAKQPSMLMRPVSDDDASAPATRSSSRRTSAAAAGKRRQSDVEYDDDEGDDEGGVAAPRRGARKDKANVPEAFGGDLPSKRFVSRAPVLMFVPTVRTSPNSPPPGRRFARTRLAAAPSHATSTSRATSRATRAFENVRPGRAFPVRFGCRAHSPLTHLAVKCPECSKLFSRKHDCVRHTIAIHHYDKDGVGPDGKQPVYVAQEVLPATVMVERAKERQRGIVNGAAASVSYTAMQQPPPQQQQQQGAAMEDQPLLSGRPLGLKFDPNNYRLPASGHHPESTHALPHPLQMPPPFSQLQRPFSPGPPPPAFPAYAPPAYSSHPPASLSTPSSAAPLDQPTAE